MPLRLRSYALSFCVDKTFCSWGKTKWTKNFSPWTKVLYKEINILSLGQNILSQEQNIFVHAEVWVIRVVHLLAVVTSNNCPTGCPCIQREHCQVKLRETKFIDGFVIPIKNDDCGFNKVCCCGSEQRAPDLNDCNGKPCTGTKCFYLKFNVFNQKL